MDGTGTLLQEAAAAGTPHGHDLGAEGPEEIAQSIVAEIVAVKRARDGGFLKERPGPIHDRPAPGAEAR